MQDESNRVQLYDPTHDWSLEDGRGQGRFAAPPPKQRPHPDKGKCSVVVICVGDGGGVGG